MSNGRERTETLLHDAIALSDASETQVSLGGGRLHVTRIAGNLVRESVEERWSRLGAQLAYYEVDGWRVGRASTSDLSPDGLEKLLQSAREDALSAEIDDSYLERPFPGDLESVVGDDEAIFDTRTAVASPVLIADALSDLTLPCHRHGYTCRGLLAIGVGSLDQTGEAGLAAIANSNGLLLHYMPTRVWLNATILTPDGGSARIDKRSTSLAGLDLPGLVAAALDRASHPGLSTPTSPGRHRVLLEPAAVGAILEWIRPQFSFRAAGNGQTAFADQLGQQLFDDRLWVSANPNHPQLLGCPFDAEGWSNRELALFQAGVPDQLFYTRSEAGQHSVPASGYDTGDGRGSVPKNLVMRGGDASLEDLVEQLDEGLLIGHIRALREEREGRLRLIGVTDNDVYTVRGGAIVGTAGSFAFKLDLAEALSDIVGFGEEAAVGDNVAPHLIVNGFEVLP